MSSGVTGPKVIKFLHEAGKSSAFQYSHLFLNASMTYKGGYANVTNFASKIDCHDNVP